MYAWSDTRRAVCRHDVYVLGVCWVLSVTRLCVMCNMYDDVRMEDIDEE